MPNESQQELEGYIAINGDLGVFLDSNKYVPILNINDEAAVVLRLSLLIENFLEIFIKNVRRPGTENFVKPARYFMAKVETSVALGLPLSIAKALVTINSIRNKFAHKLDYSMNDEDFNEIEASVNLIDIETVNPFGLLNMEVSKHMFEEGVSSLAFYNSLDYSAPLKKRKLYRLVGVVFILANKCAFFTLNELDRQGRLSFGGEATEQDT